MCSLDLEPCTVWRNTPRKARKPHVCVCCGAGIAPGTHYLDHFNVFDGNSSSESLCGFCWFIWQQFGDAHDMQPTPGALYEQLQDCIGENDDDEDEWRPLFAAIKRRWRVSTRGREHLVERIGSKQTRAYERSMGQALRDAIFPRPFSWPGGAA
jgi:hypothetical protein